MNRIIPWWIGCLAVVLANAVLSALLGPIHGWAANAMWFVWCLATGFTYTRLASECGWRPF